MEKLAINVIYESLDDNLSWSESKSPQIEKYEEIAIHRLVQQTIKSQATFDKRLTSLHRLHESDRAYRRNLKI